MNCIHMSRALEQGSTYVCFNIKPEYLIPFLSNIDGHRYIYHFLHDSIIQQIHTSHNTVITNMLKAGLITCLSLSLSLSLSLLLFPLLLSLTPSFLK